MTVAAVIVPRDVSEALADAAGRASVRRIVDVAWAGGALPIVVVVDDPDRAVTAVLAGSPARLVATEAGSSSYRVGADAALDAVVGTDGWLLWPGDRTWVDPESVTSLIEAHGAHADVILRPAVDGRPGWPVLVPRARIADGAALMVDGAVEPPDVLALELGDPGSLLTLDVPIEEVPEYVGPSAPVAGPPPDWGAAAAEEPDRGL